MTLVLAELLAGSVIATTKRALNPRMACNVDSCFVLEKVNDACHLTFLDLAYVWCCLRAPSAIENICVLVLLDHPVCSPAADQWLIVPKIMQCGASNLPPVGNMLPLLASVSRTYQHHVFAVHLSAR